MATFDSTVIARLATGLYNTQIGNATMQEALAAVNGNAYRSVGELANALYARDFSGRSTADVAALIVSNVGIKGASSVAEATGLVKQLLDATPAAQRGTTVVNLLNSFSGITLPTYVDAASAFNHQVGLAVNYARTPGTQDRPLSNVAYSFTVGTENGLGGLTAMLLTGTRGARIDITNTANQVTGVDLDDDGVIESNGVENRVTGLAANFKAVDAYSRNPFNQLDAVNNYLGNIDFDGASFQGDGKSTNGNIVLGGLGADRILAGVGNDFLAGGGVAVGRAGVDFLSGGRNADFFFAELSLLSPTDGNSLQIDGGTTSDNQSAGVTQSDQDNDWILFEGSDDDEPVTLVLRDDSLQDPSFSLPAQGTGPAIPGGQIGVVQSEFPGVGPFDRVGYIITRAGVAIGTMRDVENIDASGNLYGFLNGINVELGSRSVDSRDAAATSNYGFGSSAQLRIIGSNVRNVIIAGYDNDYIQGADGNDLIFGGNLKQLLETVTGGVTNPNLSLIPNDGRDEIYGGAGDDDLVFESDGGVIDGNATGAAIADAGTGGNDTLWLTKYSLGNTPLATLVSDSVLRFDLTSPAAMTEGTANEGAAGYGGSNFAGTADQTNYASGPGTAPEFSRRVTLTNMENIDATGLGAVDYFSAGSTTVGNRPETVFSNHQNFEGYNGNLTLRGTNGNPQTTVTNNAAGGGNVTTLGATVGDTGNNRLYSGGGNDIIEGRGNNRPVASTTATTQIDDLEGNRGNDDFYFAIDGDFTVGGASGGGIGGRATDDALLANPSPTLFVPGNIGLTADQAQANNLGYAGDGFDVIRRKIDANNDGFWDQLPATPNTQNPSNGGFVWGQDFGLDSDSTPGASVLTIDIRRTGGNPAGVELNQVVNAVTGIVTGVKQADGTFTPIVLNAPAIAASRTYAELEAAIRAGLVANTQFGADLTVTRTGSTITITDSKGRELADDFSEGGAGVAVQQLANSNSENIFRFGPAIVTTVQDRLIYKAYEDRSDNEGVDDDVILGSSVSLGTDAYAEDLVVSFQADTSTTFGTGVTTFIAEDQRWDINFDNLTTQDRVTIAVNGVTYQLQVGVQLDGTIVAGEDTNSGASQVAIQTAFLTRFAAFINSFSDNDTVAGSVFAVSSATQLNLLQRTYNGEQTVYMRAPVVTVENLSGGQSPNSPVWDNPGTGAVEGSGIANASQHEVELYQFNGRNGRLNTENVKFWGQEEVQRSILATAVDATGGTMNGLDSLIVDGELTTVLATGDLQATVANAATALITPTLNTVIDRLVTTNSALTYNFAVHGDDLLITGTGPDVVRGGTGDDRVIGSLGVAAAPAIGAVTGEVLDGGKNYYAVKLLDETQARVYVLNRWEAAAANILSVLPELAGRNITSITAIGQTESGTEGAPGILKVAATGALPAGTFSDTLQYQQEDFGANARFTITLDDFTVAGGVVQTPRDGAGLVTIDHDGDPATAPTFARFTNFENIRTVSGSGAATAATPGVSNSGGQGNDTLDVIALSTATGGISYDLTNGATAGNVNYSADAHATGLVPPPAFTAAQIALGALRPYEGDFETNILRVDGVENVNTGLGDDLVVIDETEAAKNNSFNAGLGDDRIAYQNLFPVVSGLGGFTVEPTVTINVNTSADTDTVVMTGGRLGLVVATDTLTSVEFITLQNNTAAGQQERDVLNIAGVPGGTVDYNDLLQSSAVTGTGIANSGTVRDAAGVIQVTVENLFQVERVVGSTGSETVKLADAIVMRLNSREDFGTGLIPVTPSADITFATFLDFDQLSTNTATLNQRVPFLSQTSAQIENVFNNGQFAFDLGAGSGDTVDYSNALDNISVVVELKETEPNQFVLVDAGTIEQAAVTFSALTAGQTAIVGTRTYTSTGLSSAADVAAAFLTGASALGTVVGVSPAGYSVVQGNASNRLIYTDTTQVAPIIGGNVADLTVGGTGVTVAILQGQAQAAVGATFGNVGDVQGDRIDMLTNVERIVAAQDPAESVLDLTKSDRGLEIKFSAFDLALRVPATTTLDAFDVFSIRISDLTSATPIARSFIEHRPAVQGEPSVDNVLIANKPSATWDRIEGSDFAEVVILNSAHSLDNNTFNLRGGANQVKYNELTRSITTTLLVQDFSATDPLGTVPTGYAGPLYTNTNPNAINQQRGTVMAVTQFQDGNGVALANGGTHVVTSYTANNAIDAKNTDADLLNNSSLRIAASQDAEDTLLIGGTTPKVFFLSQQGTTDNQITVRIGSGTAQNSVILTGYERVTDSASNDIYDFDSLINGIQGLDFIDTAGDHDTVKVGNDAKAFNGAGANEISLATINSSLLLAPAGFDFDVLDVTKVTDTSVTTLTGVAAGEGTDEVVIGRINNITSALLFEAVVLTEATITENGTTFVLNTTANSLVAGAKTVALTNLANTLSFGGIVLEQLASPNHLRAPGDLNATTGVTVTMVGNENANITGGNGADTITTNGGNDTLRGNLGNDTLSGGFTAAIGEIAAMTLGGGAAVLAAGETLTLTGNVATLIISASGGAGEIKTATATADADQIGALLLAQTNAFLETELGYAAGSIASKTYDASSNVFTLNFTPAAGNVADLTAAVSAGTMTAVIVITGAVASAVQSDTYVFEATATTNGVDTINNFNATGIPGTDDVLDVTAFLGAAVNNGGLPAANITAGLNLTGVANYGVVFNKASLAAADIAAVATAGRVGVEDNSKAVVLVTADADGNADGTQNAYDVYFVEDTNSAVGAQTYVVTKVASVNGPGELSAFALDGSAAFVGTAGADVFVGTDAAETFTTLDGADSVTGNGGQDTIDLTEGVPAADTVVFNSTFVAGNASADTITNFVFGVAATSDLYDVGFNVNNGTTLPTSNLAALVPAVVASNGAATANDVIFTFTGAGDVMAVSVLGDAVANAVTALTSGADFAAGGNVQTGDSFVLMLNDGARTFLFHYVADNTPATTAAADLELIGIFNGVQTGALVTGDII